MQRYDLALLDTNVPALSIFCDVSGTQFGGSVDGPAIETVVPSPSPRSMPRSALAARTHCHAEGYACSSPDGLISSSPNVIPAEVPSAVINTTQTTVVDLAPVSSPAGDVHSPVPVQP
jgi:hypothetical protein